MSQRVNLLQTVISVISIAFSWIVVVPLCAAPPGATIAPADETPDVPPDMNPVQAVRGDSEAEGRLSPLPASYQVIEHVLPESGRQRSTGLRADEQVIYSNTLGSKLFRVHASGRVADDVFTTVIGPCTLHEVRVRVSGGVERGGGEFTAAVSLYDGCPNPVAGGKLIPGTFKRFTQLDDDSAILHDLVIDFRDRGVCGDGAECQLSVSNCTDGSACTPDPLMIPGTVWLTIGVTTPDAGVIVGTPPSVGFSADGYQQQYSSCRYSFFGWPTYPHASFWIELIGGLECPVHHIGYSAANPTGPPILPTQVPGGNVTTRLADDLTLAVDDCVLSGYEVGTLGSNGPYELSVDLRWPDLGTIIPGTERTFLGLGDGQLEIARFTIPQGIDLPVDTGDLPVFVTWATDTDGTALATAFSADAGDSAPQIFAFDTDPENPQTWTAYTRATDEPGLIHAALFCRGESPTGACCTSPLDVPWVETNCIDALPATSCVGTGHRQHTTRWLDGTACEQNLFDPPCGAQACCLPDGTCGDLFRDECMGICEADAPLIPCTSDGDCPLDRACGTDTDPHHCAPECGHWVAGTICDGPSPDCSFYCTVADLREVFFAEAGDHGGGASPCSIDAREPHPIDDAATVAGWDRMIMSFDCEPFRYHFAELSDYRLWNSAGTGAVRPREVLLEGPPWRVTVVMPERMKPGEWTCVEHVQSGMEWCGGFLPGDVDQNRLVTARDINALIDSMNLVPGRVLPPYATDIDRSGLTTPADILRLIDLLNGTEDFDTWMTRNLPPCPSKP